MMSGDPTVSGTDTGRRPGDRVGEAAVAGLALVRLLQAQWILSRASHGTNYYGGDGKMAQALAISALRFAGILDATNLSPVMGIGSQMMPKNVWANPSLWPFALADRDLATDL